MSMSDNGLALSDLAIAQIRQQVLGALGQPGESSPLPVPPAIPEPATLTAAAIAAMIDHTLLKPEATARQIAAVCAEALTYRFASVCVHPTWIEQCAGTLHASPVKITSVVGFPLGANLVTVKAYEAREALSRGAAELDMVLNVGALKSGDLHLVWDDVRAVAEVTHEGGALLKVILETGYLTDEEKVAACVICHLAGADFVKTATGLGPGGATAADVRLMRRVVGGAMGVKAAGGMRTLAQALQMIAAGANRIGASASVQIIQEAQRSASGAA